MPPQSGKKRNDTPGTEYPLLRADKPCPLRRAVSTLWRNGGPETFLNTDRLREELRRLNVSETETYRVCLLAQAGGFRALLSGGGTDLETVDRFITGAVQETGLRRKDITALTGVLLAASGQRIHLVSPAYREVVPAAYPVALTDCTEAGRALQAFRTAYERWIQWGTEIREETLAALDPWISAGIPEARYLMGSYLLKRYLKSPETGGEERGVALLNEAVSDGEPRAAVVLGDYYLSHGHRNAKKAFAYYTRFGSPALTEEQKETVRGLLDRRRRNLTLLLRCRVLLAALTLILVAAHWLLPSAAGYGALVVALAEAGILSGGALWWKYGNPFGVRYHLIPLLMTVMAAFWLFPHL